MLSRWWKPYLPRLKFLPTAPAHSAALEDYETSGVLKRFNKEVLLRDEDSLERSLRLAKVLADSPRVSLEQAKGIAEGAELAFIRLYKADPLRANHVVADMLKPEGNNSPIDRFAELFAERALAAAKRMKQQALDATRHPMLNSMLLINLADHAPEKSSLRKRLNNYLAERMPGMPQVVQAIAAAPVADMTAAVTRMFSRVTTAVAPNRLQQGLLAVLDRAALALVGPLPTLAEMSAGTRPVAAFTPPAMISPVVAQRTAEIRTALAGWRGNLQQRQAAIAASMPAVAPRNAPPANVIVVLRDEVPESQLPVAMRVQRQPALA